MDQQQTQMTIDCRHCAARGPGCADCVVSLLLGAPDDQSIGLTEQERRAVDVLAQAGMVPPLRLTPPVAVTISRRPPGQRLAN